MKHHKQQYDHKIRCTKLEPGDMMMVCQKAFRGKQKIADRWENNMYGFLRKKITSLSTRYILERT